MEYTNYKNIYRAILLNIFFEKKIYTKIFYQKKAPILIPRGKQLFVKNTLLCRNLVQAQISVSVMGQAQEVLPPICGGSSEKGAVDSEMRGRASLANSRCTSLSSFHNLITILFFLFFFLQKP